jgi:NADH dehydrogenase
VEDVADCATTALAHPALGAHARFELAGPETLTCAGVARLMLRALDRPRPLLHVPTPLVSRSLRILQRLRADSVLPTWDEAELTEVSMTSTSGSADTERLGVTPKSMSAVLGLEA